MKVYSEIEQLMTCLICKGEGIIIKDKQEIICPECDGQGLIYCEDKKTMLKMVIKNSRNN